MENRSALHAGAWVGLSVSLCCAAVFLYNELLVPPLRGALYVGVDITALVSVAFFCLLALGSYYRPAVVRYGTVATITAALCVASIPLALVGLSSESAEALMAAALFFYVGTECGFLLALMASCEIGGQGRALLLLVAVGVGYFLFLVVSLMPRSWAVAVALCLPLASLLFSRSGALATFGRVNAAEPIAVTRIAAPKAVLPFSHGLFGILLVLQIAFGYGVTVEQEALGSFWPLLLLAALSVVGAAKARWLTLDGLLRVEIALVIAALVLSGWASPFPEGAAAALFACANCGNLVFLIASLSAVAAQNPAASLTMFAWGWSLSEVGIVVGANAAAWVVPEAQGYGSLALVAVFLALALFGLRRFNIDCVVAGVSSPVLLTPDETGRATPSARTLDDRCALAAEKFGLTPREAEIVALLAQGRNGVRIQESLVITRNTYKTHIRHIYEKMGVHDQQEVMDLVQSL